MSDLPFVDLAEVVDEDGEILDDVVTDEDIALDRVAQQALEATEQVKLWEARKAYFNGILAHRQIDKRHLYEGDVLVSLGASTTFNKDRWRQSVEDAGLDDDEVWTLVLNGRFSAKGLPPRLAALVEHAMESGKPFARVSRARKLAPKEDE